MECRTREGRPEAATAELGPTIRIDDTDIPDADGHDSYHDWLGRWNESWETWRVEGLELVPSGEHMVLVLFRMIATGKGSGIELGRDDGLLGEFRDGKIVRLGYYNDQAQALKAAGLTE